MLCGRIDRGFYKTRSPSSEVKGHFEGYTEALELSDTWREVEDRQTWRIHISNVCLKIDGEIKTQREGQTSLEDKGDAVSCLGVSIYLV